MDRNDFLKLINELKKREDNFWSDIYPEKSKRSKITWWLSTIHKGMRIQGEIGKSEYSEFSHDWYQWANSVEPDFDEIFKEVVLQIGFEFNWGEYLKRIQPIQQS